jgi:O-antigen/teichoic acid export membrane protein
MTQPGFHGAYVSVGPSALAQFLTGAYSILLAGMYFAKEVRFQVVVQGIAAAISVALNLLLIPRFGSAGAALALALGFLSMVLLQHAWNRRRAYLDIQYDGRRVISFALIYIAFALAFLWERELPLLAEVALSGVGAVALAGAVLLLTTKGERASIRSELRGRLSGAESP